MPRSLKALRDRHRERQRPTGFGFALADRVSYLDAAAWDAVTRDQTMFLRREILGVIESHGPENLQPRYAMVFRGAEPVAAIAAQTVQFGARQFGRPKQKRKPLLRRALSPVVRRASKPLEQRMLVGGNLLSWGFHGVAFAPGVAPTDVWPGIAEALYRIRRADRLDGQTNIVMLKDTGPGQPGVEALRRFSYRPVETEPNMVLALRPDWQRYDDYAAALDSKRRRAIRDRDQELTTAGCSVERLSALDADAARVHELYLAVHDRASVRLVTLPSGYLPAMSRAAGDSFRCTVIRRHGRIVGFVTTLRDGDTAVAYYVGFDRAEADAGLPLYLKLLHITIADAIEWRCARLSLGRTALEPKAGLGAQPEPMSLWVRHRVPSINWLLSGVVNAIPHAEAPVRNPFKGTGHISPRA